MREAYLQLKAKRFPDIDAHGERIEFIPVDWRQSLQLGGDVVNSITPTAVGRLRNLVNSSVLDLLYQASPLYRVEIITFLHNELNRLYDLFCQYNEGFLQRGGKVSIIAHSLGSVLIYDLLTGSCRLSETFTSSENDENLIQPHGSPSTRLTHGSNFIQKYPMEVRGGERGHQTNVVNSNAYLKDVDNIITELSNINIVANSQQRSEKIEYFRQVLDKAKHISDCVDKLLDYRPDAVTGRNNNDNGQDESPEELSTGTSGLSPDKLPMENTLLFRDKLENLFCIGSPLPVYLALRGIKPGIDKTQDDILPKRLCRRIFNIYHPYDPVAYRLEPLILGHYATIMPVQIHRAYEKMYTNYDELPLQYLTDSPDKGSKVNTSPPVDLTRSCRSMPDFMLENNSLYSTDSSSTSQDSKSFWNRMGFLKPWAKRKQKQESLQNLAIQDEQAVASLDSEEVGSTNFGELPDDAVSTQAVGAVNVQTSETPKLEHRLDFELNTYMESKYISAFTSHMKYHHNHDFIMFVMCQLFGHDKLT